MEQLIDYLRTPGILDTRGLQARTFEAVRLTRYYRMGADAGSPEVGDPSDRSVTMEARNAGAERGWASVVHLAAFIGLAVPFGNVLAPLTIWLLKRHESALLDDQGREAVNFQISLVVYALVFSAAMLVFILLETVPVFVAGMVVAGVAMLAVFAVIVLAAVRANRGERFRYPLSIRWIS